MRRTSLGRLFTLAIVLYGAVVMGAPQIEGDLSIRGFVHAAASKMPRQLPHVRLLTSGSTLLREAWADTAGRFSFADLPPGNYLVEVSLPGFRTTRQRVHLQSDSPTITVDLEAEAAARPVSAILDARVPAAAQREWEKAGEQMRDNRPDRARKHLEKAIQRYDEFAAAYRLLAQLDMDDGHYDRAEKRLERALAIDPHNADGLALQAAVFNHRGQASDALRLLRDAAESPSATWRVHFEMAQAEFSLKSFAEALAAARKAADLHGSPFPEAHVLLGNILVNLRQYPEAAREYAVFVKMAPDSPSAAAARHVLDQLRAAGIEVKN